MSRIIIPPPVIISKEQTIEFLIAIAKALLSLNIDDLRKVYLFHDKAVVISFSSNYEPFIGFTMSYNDPDYRVHINQETFVLTQIAEALDLQGRDIPGGRVFISKEFVYIKDLGFHRNVILFLDWQGLDPYELTRYAYEQIIDGLVS